VQGENNKFDNTQNFINGTNRQGGTQSQLGTKSANGTNGIKGTSGTTATIGTRVCEQQRPNVMADVIARHEALSYRLHSKPNKN
jgi:hypothetical protein